MFFEIYNFYEENFFKFEIDFTIKLDLKNYKGNKKFLHRILETVYEQAIPGHALTIEFMELFQRLISEFDNYSCSKSYSFIKIRF